MSLKNGLIALIVFAAFFQSCSTTPPVENPTPSPKASPTPTSGPTSNAPLTDQDYAAAKQAIAQAEEADAPRYSPNLLGKARGEYDDAQKSAASDPKNARELLKLAVNDANSARDEALAAQKSAFQARLDRAHQLLVGIQADQYRPDDFKNAEAQKAAAEEALNKDLKTAQPTVDAALKALVSLYESLNAQLTSVQRKQKAAQKALDDAEKAEAYIWVPDLLQSANDAYFQGNTHFKQRVLDQAEDDWTKTEFLAQSAIGKAQKERDRKKTEDLMLETMKKIQKASGTTIVDPNDNIIEPKKWDGDKELKKLQDLPQPTATPQAPQSMRIPTDGSVVVLGEKSRISYLDEAKDAWSQGVLAMKKEDYTLASQYFLQAQKLVDTYMAMAVEKVYTVRLIPERRDSLWRISEYDNIYANPFDWPKIWKRNKKLIQNPDLIYPGWQLIIPPQ